MIAIGGMLLTMTPIIFGGVLNMVFVKAPILDGWKVPMDGGRTWRDGARVFGDNKTWKGFAGMVILTAFAYGIYGALLAHAPSLAARSIVRYGLGIGSARAFADGALLGLAYVLAELPNSFIKRRIGIGAGKNASGARGIVFTFVDQADSVIGCVAVLALIAGLGWLPSIALIAIGSGIHLAVNGALFLVGLKKQAR